MHCSPVRGWRYTTATQPLAPPTSVWVRGNPTDRWPIDTARPISPAKAEARRCEARYPAFAIGDTISRAPPGQPRRIFSPNQAALVRYARTARRPMCAGLTPIPRPLTPPPRPLRRRYPHFPPPAIIWPVRRQALSIACIARLIFPENLPCARWANLSGCGLRNRPRGRLAGRSVL